MYYIKLILIAKFKLKQVKSHSKSTGHIQHEAVLLGHSSQRTISADGGLSAGKFVLTEPEHVIKAETLWAFKCVKANFSFASNEEDVFKIMFPDSQIASKYAMGETKTKYVIQHGIAPYVHHILVQDLKQQPFTFKFDETTTNQVKKQYDGYVQYYSPKFDDIINHYCGSLFLGKYNKKQTIFTVFLLTY